MRYGIAFRSVVYLVMRIWMLLVNSVGYFNSLKLKDCGFMLSSLLVVSLCAGCLFIMLVVFVYCGRCLFVVEFGLRFGQFTAVSGLAWLVWAVGILATSV